MSSALPIPLSRVIVEFGPPIGEYRGYKIAEWVKAADGSRSNFWGVTIGKADEVELGQGQIMLDPGLIYERQ